MRGDFTKLRELERNMRELPAVVGAKVATAAARTITELAQRTFAAGENAYGDSWAPGAEGQRVTLRRSGGLARGVAYTATGTRLRAVLSARYAKYQVGKRPVFPRGRLPIAYVQAIATETNRVIHQELGQ